MKVRSRMRKSRKRRICMLVVFLVLALLIAADHAVRPTVRAVAISQTQNRIGVMVQRSVLDTIAQDKIHYSSLVSLSQNNNGDTIALTTDTVRINQLQSELLQKIMKDLGDCHEMDIRIPLGTLFGSQWMAGIGPLVTFRLLPTGIVRTRILNQFDAAGINQTRHQIQLRVTVDMLSVLPGYRISSEVETTVVLAETIIVGLVPEAYTEVYGGTDDLVGMIQDYGAAEG